VATLPGDDIILCQVTSVEREDTHAISLREKDFAAGKLPVESVIRPSRLFTAEKSIVLYKAGQLAKSKIREIEQMLVKILTQ
jgi:mRNA interferase MazF